MLSSIISCFTLSAVLRISIGLRLRYSVGTFWAFCHVFSTNIPAAENTTKRRSLCADVVGGCRWQWRTSSGWRQTLFSCLPAGSVWLCRPQHSLCFPTSPSSRWSTSRRRSTASCAGLTAGRRATTTLLACGWPLSWCSSVCWPALPGFCTAAVAAISDAHTSDPELGTTASVNLRWNLENK